jgi:hypothetical protein
MPRRRIRNTLEDLWMKYPNTPGFVIAKIVGTLAVLISVFLAALVLFALPVLLIQHLMEAVL